MVTNVVDDQLRLVEDTVVIDGHERWWSKAYRKHGVFAMGGTNLRQSHRLRCDGGKGLDNSVLHLQRSLRRDRHARESSTHT